MFALWREVPGSESDTQALLLVLQWAVDVYHGDPDTSGLARLAEAMAGLVGRSKRVQAHVALGEAGSPGMHIRASLMSVVRASGTSESVRMKLNTALVGLLPALRYVL